jgi:1-phosphofructokinase
LDADGEALKLALENPQGALPDYLKPNKFELLEYFGIKGDAPDLELIRLSQSLIAKGAELVAVSKGGEGALFVTGRGAWGAPALKVKISSTVGAGDSMIGALLFGMEANLPEEELWKLALSAGAGACVTPGTNPPEKKLVEELMAKSLVSKIS